MRSLSRKNQALKIIWAQLTTSVLVALVFLWLASSFAAFSALVGGLICVVPNLIFVVKFFKNSGANQAKLIVKSFYKAEALKLLLTIVLFLVVILKLKVLALPLFVGFIITQMVFWFAPLITK